MQMGARECHHRHPDGDDQTLTWLTTTFGAMPASRQLARLMTCTSVIACGAQTNTDTDTHTHTSSLSCAHFAQHFFSSSHTHLHIHAHLFHRVRPRGATRRGRGSAEGRRTHPHLGSVRRQRELHGLHHQVLVHLDVDRSEAQGQTQPHLHTRTHTCMHAHAHRNILTQLQNPSRLIFLSRCRPAPTLVLLEATNTKT